VERIAGAVVVQGVTAGPRLLPANGEQPSFPPLFDGKMTFVEASRR
jgi:hypothetical protein